MTTIAHEGIRRWAWFLKIPGKVIIGATVASVVAAVGGATYVWQNPPPVGNPGFTGTCLVSNRTLWEEGSGNTWRDCIPGATITVNVTDPNINPGGITGMWNCNGNVATLAANAGGTLPLKVIINYQVAAPNVSRSVRFDNTCFSSSNSNDELDLIIEIRGDGRTFGGGNDGIQVASGANGAGTNSLVVAAYVQCGPREASAHQDGIQHQNGRNVVWVNPEVGGIWANPDNTATTCQGAAGGFDISPISGTVFPQNITVYGARVMACNSGLNIGDASFPTRDITIVDTKVRGQDPFSLAAGQCTSQPPNGICSLTTNPDVTNIVTTNVLCDTYLENGGYGTFAAFPDEG